MAVIIRNNGVAIDNAADDIDFRDGLSVVQLTPGVVQISVPTGGILAAMIADNSVSTTKIQDAAVTPAKLDRAYWQFSQPTWRPFVNFVWQILDGSVVTNAPNAATTNFPASSGLIIPNDANYTVLAEISVVCQQSTNANTCAVSLDVATDSGFVNIILTTPETITKRNDYATLDCSGGIANRRNETLWLRAKVRSAGGSNSNIQSIEGRIVAIPQS